MALTREQILAADDLPRTEVYVDAWKGSVWLRHLTLAEALALGGESKEALAARVLVLTAHGDDGKPLFTDADIQALAGKNSQVMAKLLKEALDLNGMGVDAVKAAEGN